MLLLSSNMLAQLAREYPSCRKFAAARIISPADLCRQARVCVDIGKIINGDGCSADCKSNET
jgi:hypothetical protein